ncbi:hypothetical protein M1328_01775 [Patescibacteria group bacterium]|nr:hypothetical protein [Patescibacteria group bacterium]
MKPEFKKYAIIGAGIVVLLVGGFFLLNRGNGQKNQSAQPTPTEEVMPTVDSSVKVSMTGANNNHEVDLAVDNLPSGTQSIDYELSYQTASQGLQGVIGTASTNGESSFTKHLTLGTCSSGTCVYHQVVGKISLTLKFTGDYGQKIYQKDFSL